MRPRNHWSPRTAIGSITTSSSITTSPPVRATGHDPARRPSMPRGRQKDPQTRKGNDNGPTSATLARHTSCPRVAPATGERQDGTPTLVHDNSADHGDERRAVTYVTRRQSEDGGWSLFEGGPSDLSATIKIYFAMKMAGVSPEDPVMLRAGARIRAMGGPAGANVFCKILLALFGEYDWNGVPTMPVEIMLLPTPFFLFNIYEVSYWSRCVIVPLLIVMDRKPVKWLSRHLTLDELWPEGREHTSLRFPRVPEPFSWRGLFWKSFF